MTHEPFDWDMLADAETRYIVARSALTTLRTSVPYPVFRRSDEVAEYEEAKAELTEMFRIAVKSALRMND